MAVSALDTTWTMTADGKHAAPLVAEAPAGVERDPVFAPDGARVAFAADRGAGFDIGCRETRARVRRAMTDLHWSVRR